MSPTPYAELNEVLEALVSGVRGELRGNVEAIWLQGSFALGDFDEHSDVDFIVLLGKSLDSEEVARLDALHGRLFRLGSEWARHLEGSYFTREELAALPGAPVWYLDHGHTRLVRSAHCNTWVVRWTLNRFGVWLFGPDPGSVVPPVDGEDLRAEVRATLLDWGHDILRDPEPYRNRFYQGFIVLSYARMLHTLDECVVGSKRAGAEWAKETFPPPGMG